MKKKTNTDSNYEEMINAYQRQLDDDIRLWKMMQPNIVQHLLMALVDKISTYIKRLIKSKP